MSDNTHQFVIPANTTLAIGEAIAFRVDDPAVTGNFGLGATDSARLFPAGTTVLSVANEADSYSWTAHAATTWGADPDGSDNFTETASSTFGEPNDFTVGTIGNIAGVKLNEVESNGDATNGDWVELYNTTGAAINIDGAIITDADPAHQFVVPDVAPLAAGGYAAFRVDNPATPGNFGLGSADSAKLYAPGDVTLATVVDEFSWTLHATNTYGRDVAGAGSWAATSAGTFAAVNQISFGTIDPLTGVVINEVESHGDTTNGDWIELKNTSGTSVNLDNAVLSDNSNNHAFRIPTSTPNLAAGAVTAFRVDSLTTGDAQFGLGDDDSARLFKADVLALTDTSKRIDIQSWTTHTLQTRGLNGSGSFVATNLGTFGTANDFTSSPAADISNVVLNEVMTHGDWVELLNTTSTQLNIGNTIIADLSGNSYTIPANTLIDAGDTFVVNTTAQGFGFDGDDGVRFYRPGATVGTSTPIDHHEWEQHPTNDTASFARTSSGLGDWTVDETPSMDAAN